MRIVLATSNRGKVKEIESFLDNYEVVPYSDLIEPFEIEESGDSYKANAIIKAEAIYKKLNDKNAIVLSDDSGISIDILDGKPNIYSARFAGANATDRDNVDKVIFELKSKSAKSSKAHYCASIAIVSKEGVFTTHGWMYGSVIDEIRGSNGFGYDPIFIPEGFDKTLGELDDSIKKDLSHRSEAIENAKYILKTLKR